MPGARARRANVFDRINVWEDVEFRQAIGRRKLIMTVLWTEACLTFLSL